MQRQWHYKYIISYEVHVAYKQTMSNCAEPYCSYYLIQDLYHNTQIMSKQCKRSQSVRRLLFFSVGVSGVSFIFPDLNVGLISRILFQLKGTHLTFIFPYLRVHRIAHIPSICLLTLLVLFFCQVSWPSSTWKAVYRLLLSLSKPMHPPWYYCKQSNLKVYSILHFTSAISVVTHRATYQSWQWYYFSN